MENANHLVKKGEVLSQIARIYSTDIATLKRLNPFIRNEDQIQVGWNLSVPKSSASPASQAADAGGGAAAPGATATGDNQKVLKLPKVIDKPTPCTESFADGSAPKCSPEYESIIYATQEQCFWLLSNTAANALSEASKTLADLVSPNKAPDDRKLGLDKSGLLDYFMEPTLASFLDDQDRARMHELEVLLPGIGQKHVASKPTETSSLTPAEALDARMAQSAQHEAEIQEMNRRRQLTREIREWYALKEKALTIAKSQGYTYEAGHLFSAQAIECSNRVQAYLKAREPILAGKLGEFEKKPIAELLKEDQQRYIKAREKMASGGPYHAELNSYRIWSEKKKTYQAYVNCIMAVAEYGLAVPEYALMGDGEVASGVNDLLDYFATKKEQAEVDAQLQGKYRSWIDATGQNIKAPAGLVAEERKKWDRLQAKTEELQAKAEANVRNSKVRLHLLWSPEQFRPEPVQRLVKHGFPLREISLPSKKEAALSQFSLKDLDSAKTEGLLGKGSSAEPPKGGAQKPAVLKAKLPGEDAVRKAIEKYAQSTKGAGAKVSAQDVFEQWLLEQGALKVDDQRGDWFNAEGLFEIDKFHACLQGWNLKVKLLEDSGTRQDWGIRLRQILFKADIRSGMRLIDTSPEAQLVRCLTPPRKIVQASFKADAPSFDLADGFKAEASASLDIDLARGELEIAKVDLPARNLAKDVLLAYQDKDGLEKTMNLGRFSLHWSTRAWGYAGASLMLATGVALSRDNLGIVKLDPTQPAERDGEANRPDTGDASNEPPSQSEDKQAGSTKASTSKTLRSGQADRNINGYTANLEKGAQASFKLFAGVQAGIEMTGALNWAPPKDVVALRTAPGAAQRQNSTGAVTAANEWLTLASLKAGGMLGAGIGAEGEVSISLENNCLVLRLSAQVVFGTGGKTSLGFEIGYGAIADLLNLFRRALHENGNRPLRWVTPDAETYMSGLSALGSIGLDVAMLVTMGYDTVMSLYKVFTGDGRGGPIADSIVNYANPEELEQWVVECPSKALGPLLMTLISEPSTFTVKRRSFNEALGRFEDKEQTIPPEECQELQQRAIERILGWIVKHAATGGKDAAQMQFEEAHMRFSEFGARNANPGKAYCVNRMRVDKFMDEVTGASEDGKDARENYKKHLAILGNRLDGFCIRESLSQEDLEFMDPALRLPGAVFPSTKMVSVRYDDNGMGPDLKMREVN